MYLIFLMLLLTFATPATAQEQGLPPPPELPELQIEPPETEDPFFEEPIVIIENVEKKKLMSTA